MQAVSALMMDTDNVIANHLRQHGLAEVAGQALDGLQLGVGLPGAGPDVAEVVEDTLLQRNRHRPEFQVLAHLRRFVVII